MSSMFLSCIVERRKILAEGKAKEEESVRSKFNDLQTRCIDKKLSNSTLTDLRNRFGCFGCWEQERISLLQYKASVNYTDDYHVTPWDSANKESDCCEWEGVKCNITTGHVIQLALNSTISYWSGESERGSYFNASLFLSFEELQYLDLSENWIRGWVPNEGTEFIS